MGLIRISQRLCESFHRHHRLHSVWSRWFRRSFPTSVSRSLLQLSCHNNVDAPRFLRTITVSLQHRPVISDGIEYLASKFEPSELLNSKYFQWHFVSTYFSMVFITFENSARKNKHVFLRACDPSRENFTFRSLETKATVNHNYYSRIYECTRTEKKQVWFQTNYHFSFLFFFFKIQASPAKASNPTLDYLRIRYSFQGSKPTYRNIFTFE